MMLKRGQMSYAGGGANTRSASIFFTVKPNPYLGREPWEVPFAEVVPPGMDVVDSFYAGYGDFPIFKCANCNAPDVSRYWLEGNSYLKREFPNLDYMVECRIVEKTKAADITSSHTEQGMPKAPREMEKEVDSNQGIGHACFGFAGFLAASWIMSLLSSGR